jgi:multiple sugar transport system substrate-binding protein
MFERRSVKLGVVLLAMAMLSTIVFTGCATKEGKSEFTFVAAQYSNATEPYWKNLIENFQKENPDIKVNLQVVGWDVISQKVNTLISTNQAPDLLNIDLFSAYVNDDLLMDASKVISPELRARFYDSMYKGNEIDGVNYAIPLGASVRSLYYNKDIFAKAGIANPPKTWTELRQDAKIIKDKTGIDAFGIEMTDFEGEAFFSYFAFGNGGGWKKDGKWALNSPENIVAFNFMNDLINTDKVTNPKPTAINRDELQKVFGAGKLAMMLTANFFPTILKTDAPELNYGVSPMPVNDGKPPTALFVQDSLMVFKSAKNLQAIGKFLDYFYKDENYQDFMTKEGFLPAIKSVGDTMSAQDPITAEFIQELSEAQTYPVADINYPEIKVEAIKALQKVILGESSVESALNDLQKMAEGK